MADDMMEKLSGFFDSPESMDQFKEFAKGFGVDLDASAGETPPPAVSASTSSLPIDAGDLALLQKIRSMMGRVQTDDKNVQLLRALKPHLSQKRAGKVDEAVRMMQMFKMLPLLKESGFFGGDHS